MQHNLKMRLIYYRYPHLFANWRLIFTEAEVFREEDDKINNWLPSSLADEEIASNITSYQPVHVLEKKTALDHLRCEKQRTK